MAKKGREIVKLLSSAQTGYFYTTTKNKKTASAEKMEFMKYDPIAKKHVMFKETKIGK